MNEHQRPADLPPAWTRVTYQFSGGTRVVRIINWNDRNAVKRFAHMSRKALLSGPGATTSTERLPSSFVPLGPPVVP